MSNDSIKLDVDKREVTGKKVATLRRDGLLPMVIYGADFTPMNIQASTSAIEKVVREAGTHSPVEVVVEGQPQTAVIKTIDMNPVTNTIDHIAFQAVSQDQVVTTDVPVVIIGEDESEAKKAGLVILQSTEKIEIKAKPADLPKSLEVSAANLAEHGDRLTVADIKLPAGVEFVEDDPELTIATVYEPAALAAANEAADAKADAAAADVAGDTETTEGEVPAEGAETAGDDKSGEAKAE